MFYVAATAAVLITGISKSGFGGGLGILGVPLMAFYIPPFQAAAIMLPILCLADIFTVWHYRSSWDRLNIKIMLPAALIGILVGALTFSSLSDAHIRILIGAIAMIFSIRFFLKRNTAEKREANVVRGSFWGLLCGFFSFSVHSGAPPANVYLLPLRLDKTIFVGTLAVLMAILNYAKLIPYAMLDQLNTENLLTSLILSPLVPLGVWLGVVLHRIIPQQPFYLVCYALLTLMGAKLLYDGYVGL